MSIKIASFEITIDGVTYRADNVRQVSPPLETKRLILLLVHYASDEESIPTWGNIITKRSHILKETFAHVFPNAPKFSEISHMRPRASEWNYVLHDAREEHIKWARAAKECGLIDSYIVDYDPCSGEKGSHDYQ